MTMKKRNSFEDKNEEIKKENKSKNYIYILKCSDNTLYTGWTNNLENRVINHNTKKGAKYTKNRLPAYLKYFEVFDNKIEAMKREYEVKTFSRQEKEKLVNSFKGIRKNKIRDEINNKIKNINDYNEGSDK